MNTFNCITKLFALSILLAIVLLAAASPLYAAKRKNNRVKPNQTKLWQQVDETSLQSRGERSVIPQKYLVYRVNNKILKDVLAAAPLEFTDKARKTEIIFELPTPEGKLERFRIEESPLLAPEVAAQFPTWKNFTGKGIDDPTATAAFDINDNGFHGYVVGSKGTYLVDPYSESDRDNYIVYYKGDVRGSGGNFICGVGGEIVDTKLENSFDSFLAPQFANGGNLRTLRLAVSATKEYTNFFGGNVNTAFAAINTSVARMNVLYRRELSVRFILVSDTRTVFRNTNNGGFPDASNANVADLSIAQNPKALNAVYGVAAYDIGHAVSRTPSPNGLASSPSICADNAPAADPTSTYKGQGFTGAPVPQGDGYDVDYLAHEIGHQFGMAHTFNNNADGSCTTRTATSAFEPASGVTIMGYGGICAPRNLAQNSIDVFHARSLEQSLAELATNEPQPGGTCGTTQAVSNAAPVVNAGASFTIPRLTPFTLTGSATDATTSGLTYSWEEYDLGTETASTGAVDDDATGARPIFRSYQPMTTPSRTFPSLTYILNPQNNDPVGSNQPTLTYTGTLPNAPTSGSTNGYVCAPSETCARGERLPTIARTMTFRLTVRDNFDANSGGVADATTTLTVAGNAGPFQVTTQNSAANLMANETYAPDVVAPAVTWQIGTAQNVTWDMANTTAAPISTANVNILLSTDGGLTFPITLKANTPNDGSEPITVPNNPTQTARIKVEAVGNIYFDINNMNFVITAPTAATVSVSGHVTTSSGRGIMGVRLSLTDSNGQIRTATTTSFGYYKFADVQIGMTYILSATGKHYTFRQPVQVLNINEEINEVNFTANVEKRLRAF